MKKKLLTMLCAICLSGLGLAQPFAPLQNIDPNTGQEPNEIASGDLDGDGDMDVVMATYFYNGGTPVADNIKWYKNDGNGNFTVEPSVSSTIRWVDGLTVADIDGQFGLDIVATSAIQNKLVYFLSDGTGFGPEIVVDAALIGPGEVVAGDINNDGYTDLATMSYDNNRTVWYANDGSGNFTPQADIENGSTDGPFYIDVADFDGDFDLDVLVGFFNSQTIEIYYNQYIESGSATVSWVKDAVTVSSGNSYLFGVSFADVNNDGTLDILKVDFTSGDVAWYDKTKDGPSVEHIIQDNTIISNPARAFVVDLDHDALNDVIVTDGGAADDAMIYFKGNSNASPNATPVLIVNNNYQMYDIAVEDYDGDTDMDIALIGNHSDTVDWIENQNIVLGLTNVSPYDFSMYPNPAQDRLNFKGPFVENLNISIYDMVGQQIMVASISDGSTLDVSSLRSGVYLVKTDDGNSVLKFVKQ